MRKDFPCICGHSKKDHRFKVCTVRSECDPEWADNCMEFEPDNLRYLEQLQKQKVLQNEK